MRFLLFIAVTLVYCCLSFLARANSPSVKVLTNISLMEFVYLLNDKTRLQVNLEMANESNASNGFDLIITNLAHFTRAELQTVMKNVPLYTIVTNGEYITIAPKPRPGIERALDYQIPNFGFTNLPPFMAGHLIAQKLPFILSCNGPYPFDKETSPGFLDLDLPHWPTNSMHPISLKIKESRLREVLCLIFNSQRKAYWITSPVHSPMRLKHLSSGTKLIEMEVLCPEDEKSLGVFLKRDEAYQNETKKRFEELLNKK